MITTSMLRRQVWITDDHEFDHTVENSQRVLKLNAQYENHTYVKEFTKKCSVMFVYGMYVLEEEADAKFSLGKIWSFLQAGSLPNNASTICRQMKNCMRAWKYIQKTSGSPLSIETIKQTYKIMMDKEKIRMEKMYSWGKIESHLHLQATIFLHQPAILKGIWNVQILGFMKL